MTVNDIRFFLKIDSNTCPQKQNIKIKLVPRGTSFQFCIPRNIDDPLYSQIFEVSAIMVSGQHNFMALSLEGPDLTQDSHMTAAIGKKRCGGDMQYLHLKLPNPDKPEPKNKFITKAPPE